MKEQRQADAGQDGVRNCTSDVADAFDDNVCAYNTEGGTRQYAGDKSVSEKRIVRIEKGANKLGHSYLSVLWHMRSCRTSRMSVAYVCLMISALRS